MCVIMREACAVSRVAQSGANAWNLQGVSVYLEHAPGAAAMTKWGHPGLAL